jgi:hypothetical protein
MEGRRETMVDHVLCGAEQLKGAWFTRAGSKLPPSPSPLGLRQVFTFPAVCLVSWRSGEKKRPPSSSFDLLIYDAVSRLCPCKETICQSWAPLHGIRWAYVWRKNKKRKTKTNGYANLNKQIRFLLADS